MVGLSDGTVWDRDRPILGDLQAASRFRRRWWLIYPMALLYLATIFPGSYAVGRNTRRVRWFYMMFLSSVAVFAVVFITLGRVGGGEQNRLRSATLARSFGNGLYDVTQWMSLAPLHGDSFVISHRGSGRLYASGEDFETVLGQAVAGTEAHLEMDIPPASTRPAISRFRAEGPPYRLQVLSADASDGRLQAFSVLCDPFPSGLQEAAVAYRDRVYPLMESGGSLVAEVQRPALTAVHVSGLDQFQATKGLMTPAGFDRDERSTDDLFSRLDQRLIGNAFGLTHELSLKATTLESGIARVMLFTDYDSNFLMEGDRFPDRRGCVLYVFDLPIVER
jgi:hypothetical protein